jgi:AcrR family transcriptional regulator
MSLEAEGDPDTVQTLPRGRHKLPAHVVRASQRERLLRAMLESVAKRGYDATTVPGVVADARVSRNAFYELFSDKTDCFLALCDQLAGEILDEVSATTETEWVPALRAGMARYLSWWAQRPAFSRTYFVELPSAGPRAVAQRETQYARFRSLFEEIAAWARRQQPELPALRPVAIRAVVVAVTELISEEVRAGRVQRLTELEDELVFLTVLLLADEATARRAAERPGR